MKTKNFFLSLLLATMMCVPFTANAQVTIGSATAPHEFSILELISYGERGLRLPKMTTDQRNNMQAGFGALANTEARGLQIFNIDTHCVETWSGTRWISKCSCPRGGIEINGVCWATRNVDRPGTFASAPEAPGMFFQWNRGVGWSSSDPRINSDGGTDWSTVGAEGTEWYGHNDPCPPGWRVPTHEELVSLHNATNNWVEDWNETGINGRLFGTYPNQIFLPASGWRGLSGVVGGLRDINTLANYWGSTWNGKCIELIIQ